MLRWQTLTMETTAVQWEQSSRARDRRMVLLIYVGAMLQSMVIRSV